MTFDDAFAAVIGFEGNYSNNPSDKGGETKFGISHASHPNENISALTLDRAKAIYLHEYWGPAGCDALPDLLKQPLFDFAVNSGVKPAVKTLQAILCVETDGIIGPKTLAAANSANELRLAIALNLQRLLFHANLADFDNFGRGWVRRDVNNLLSLLHLVK